MSEPVSQAQQHGALPISLVIPARNAAHVIEVCLAAAKANGAREIIVVDGESEDETVSISHRFADQVLSDGGGGVAYARQMGAEAATSSHVAFIDVDIELPSDALSGLLNELQERNLEAIQAGLHSVGGVDYWSRALVAHHNRGRSKRWFGVMSSLFQRDVFLRYGMDPAFRTGEDIELRYRLRKGGARVAVSDSVVVNHSFEPGFGFALGQFLADGAGLGRMFRKHGWPAFSLLAIPVGGAVLGVFRSLVRQPVFIPYYVLYAIFNYVGIVRGLLDRNVKRAP